MVVEQTLLETPGPFLHPDLSAPAATICNVTQRLTPQQHRALDLLATGTRTTDVATDLGIDRTTLWRWQSESAEFQAELNRRRHELWDASVERVRSLVPLALDALEAELGGPHRLRAATAILDMVGFRAHPKSSIPAHPSGAITAEGVERARAEARALDELLRPLAGALSGQR